MSEQERDEATDLAERVEALRAERDRLVAEVERARLAVEDKRAQRDASTKARVAAVRRRQALIGSGIGTAVLAGLVVYIQRDSVDRETLRGQVASIAGPAPVAEGDACTVRVEPAYFPFNAWMQVDCGGRRLYGYESYGHIDCDSADGRAQRCEDGGAIVHDGDPHLALDRPAGRLVVDDGERWRIEVALARTR